MARQRLVRARPRCQNSGSLFRINIVISNVIIVIVNQTESTFFYIFLCLSVNSARSSLIVHTDPLFLFSPTPGGHFRSKTFCCRFFRNCREKGGWNDKFSEKGGLKRWIFRKGGGSLQSEKFRCRFCTPEKKAQHSFPKRGGGQRPCGSFQKIHPKWSTQSSLMNLS